MRMEGKGGRTIAAISTAQAPGGIGIIRISGPDALKIADRVFFPKTVSVFPGKRDIRFYTERYAGFLPGKSWMKPWLPVFAGPEALRGRM